MNGIGFSYRKYIAIIALQIVLVMTVLDITIINVALPVLAEKFSISNSSAVWIVTVYQLVITMLLLPVSSIGDLFSHKRTYLTGVVVFTAASALCAISPNFTTLVIARALQGVGAACVFGTLLLMFCGQSPSEWNIAWRMAICGIGFGMFQTPNNVVMVMATPIHRAGGAGGMQSTARLVGQTFGATLVSTIFALTTVVFLSVRVSLLIAVVFAVVAGVFSYTRTIGHKNELHVSNE